MEQPNFPLSSESWPNLDNSSNVKVSSKQVERSKKCDLCPFETHKNQNLKKHKKIHEKVTPVLQEPLKCKECNKFFTKREH